jgi:hypothetical protein
MFSPRDFLDLAKNITNCATLDKNEALSRSVISRAYYSAFLHSREKIDSIDRNALSHSTHNLHTQIIELFQNNAHFFKQDPTLSSDLMELQTCRVDADYHFPNAKSGNEQRQIGRKSPDSIQTAQDCCGLATNIINRVDCLK